MKKAVLELSLIILLEFNINSNYLQYTCVWRSGKMLVLFLWRQPNRVERYRALENGRNFFVWVYNQLSFNIYRNIQSLQVARHHSYTVAVFLIMNKYHKIEHCFLLLFSFLLFQDPRIIQQQLDRVIDFINRYFFLICFCAYLMDEVNFVSVVFNKRVFCQSQHIGVYKIDLIKNYHFLTMSYWLKTWKLLMTRILFNQNPNHVLTMANDFNKNIHITKRTYS